jgi:hypothetical protein
MITNDGVELISKYLVGQASSYAAYVAVGSGSRATSNNNPITLTGLNTATIGDYDGTPPYQATITLSAGYWGYLQVGDIITANDGSSPTGSLGLGTVTVIGIDSPQKIQIESTSTLTAGKISYVKAYSLPNSDSFSSKKNLDFEVARFPITSRSYVVEKQTVKSTTLNITGDYEITVITSTAHTFAKGDTVQIVNVVIPADVPGGPLNGGIEVNGLYKITSVTDTSFVAEVYDKDLVLSAFPSSAWNVPYYGNFDNLDLFNSVVYIKQISLSAEMLDTNNYDISELGIYSLGSNQYSSSGNSRMLFNFSQTEGWEYYNDSTSTRTAIATIAPLVLPIGSTPKFCSTTDAYWNSTYIKQRKEKPRVLEDGLIVPGDLSSWDGTNFEATSNYLVLTDPAVNLSKSAATDEIRLAYSIMNATNLPTALPEDLYIRIRFICSNGTDSADLDFHETGTTVINPNRYAVLSKKLSEITATSGFDWSQVTSVRIYSALENAAGATSNDYAVILDGLRFENLGTENPLYALTGYTVVNNETATNIIKPANSNDLINFRLDFSVGS